MGEALLPAITNKLHQAAVLWKKRNCQTKRLSA
jgi:hypothetical protein